MADEAKLTRQQIREIRRKATKKFFKEHGARGPRHLRRRAILEIAKGKVPT